MARHTHHDGTTESEAPPASKEEKGFLSSLFGAGTLVTAWVFVTGWTYLHTYYRHFGVNINSLNFSTFQFPVFTFTQFVSFSWSGLVLGCVCVAAVLLAWWGALLKKPHWALLVTLAYLFLFWAGFRIAFHRGQEEAIHDMGCESDLPQITVQLADAVHPHHLDFDESIHSDKLRLLIEQNDRILVFVPVSDQSANFRMKVFQIDRKDIAYSIRSTMIPGKEKKP